MFPKPLVQYRSHGFNDLFHHICVIKQTDKEIIVLLIPSRRHFWEILLKQKHERLAVIILCAVLPLVLGGVIVLNLE